MFPDCRVANGKIRLDTGSLVVLTIAHMDQVIENNDDSNLRALCQRCHLAWDSRWRRENPDNANQIQGTEEMILRLAIEKNLLGRQLEEWERWDELGIVDYLPVFAKKLFRRTSKKTTSLLNRLFGPKGKRWVKSPKSDDGS